MKQIICIFLIFLSLPIASGAHDQNLYQDRIVVGMEEIVLFPDLESSFKARIDTGAKTSSIHASQISFFDKDNEKRVRFNMDYDGVDRILDCALESMVLIRQASSQTPAFRPVVTLDIEIGPLHKKALFTLADRSHMSVAVLIGRNVLADDFLVDASVSFLQSADDY